MLTQEFLSNLAYNHQIHSHNSIFEYLFLRGLVINVSTKIETDNCNKLLAELHWFEKILMDENRKYYQTFNQTELTKYESQSEKAIQYINNFTSEQCITREQAEYLLNIINKPHLFSYDFEDFCKISNVYSQSKIKINHSTNRTITWDLIPYKLRKKITYISR